jgi:DNA-binding GntR family transcriptional regulator
MKANGETSYQRVAKQLRTEIIEGKIANGDWLRMSAIADRLRVSVQPVREALQQLEGEGLVEMIPNHGAKVRSVDSQRLIHFHEIGEALEAYFARQFAEEAPMRAIRELETLQGHHDKAIKALDWPQIDAANTAFHRHINFGGGNQEAVDIIQRHHHLSQTLLNKSGRTRGFADRVMREHHMLLDAIRKRDGETASKVAAAHVRGTMNDVLEAIKAAERD